MISQEAKSSFNYLMRECFCESLKIKDTSPTINTCSNLESINEEEFIMLTVCSTSFKAYNFLHFTKNEYSIDYVATALDKPVDFVDNNVFYDYLGEMCNTFSGAFKRELGHYVTPLGMSTPNRLTKNSLLSIKDDDYGYVSHFEAKIHEQKLFYGSLYINASKELDFSVSHSTKLDDDIQIGGLELF